MPVTRVAFPGSSQPEAWLDEAVGLYKVAEEVFATWRRRVGDYRIEDGASIPGEVVIDHTYFLKVYLLLTGLSIENLLKGVIVARQPEMLRSKRLIWQGVRQGGHHLGDLLSRAGFEPSQAEDDVLEALTEAIVWSGRYPVHLDHSSLNGRIFRLAKDRSVKAFPSSFAEMPSFHRRVFQDLFRRIFVSYPVSTQPHQLVTIDE